MGLSARHILNNMSLLAAMDTVVQYLNDEEGFDSWLMCGVPDGHDDDDLLDMASDNELMDWACHAFRSAMRYANAGWFTHPYGDDSEGSVAYGADDDYEE